MVERVKSLRDFYGLMAETAEVRRTLVQRVLESTEDGVEDSAHLRVLERALQRLGDVPREGELRVLSMGERGGGAQVRLNLSYEMEELKKDIFYLTHTEEEFGRYLSDLHPGHREQLERCLGTLSGIGFRNFVADRDGTLNNYCGRYASSIQSVYNAVFLARFAAACTENAVILTSAPLSGGGLLDVSVSPAGVFIYAGSKGREYVDREGQRSSLPVDRDQQDRLDRLNRRLERLVKEPGYELFSLIGSGLQFKFGQTTIAKQDIYGSVPEEESRDLERRVEEILQDIDPGGVYFRTEDTGKDIEILLTVSRGGDSGRLKEFDKGDGVDFLDEALSLRLEQGPNLVCGDTLSDVPMVRSSVRKTELTWAVFVTSDETVRRKAAEGCPNHCFVTEPDTLVCVLNALWERKTS
jgi:hypothetical protein